MTATDRGAKRRARRVAPDEAHAWARNLRLKNPHARLVLLSLTLYVDPEGRCFVGIPTLAEDTELSAQTVRNRLAWLEQVGAIRRIPQWIDEYGVRNAEANGRRTSDLIKLCIEADEVAIEASASGGGDNVSREVDPIHGIGSGAAAETVDPVLALRRPYDSAEGLTSEQEHEQPLKSPEGDEHEGSSADQGEPEHFGPAWVLWRGHEVMRRDLALAEFRKLSEDKQAHCRAAIPLFNQMQDRLKRTHTPNFHLWIRSGGFEEFPGASLDKPAGRATSHDGRAAQALRALYHFARVPLFEHGGKVVYSLPITARVLAFVDVPPERDWCWIDEPGPLAAWSAFLTAHIPRARPDISEMGGNGEVKRRGIKAPWHWPPRKDGTLSPIGETGEGDAA